MVGISDWDEDRAPRSTKYDWARDRALLMTDALEAKERLLLRDIEALWRTARNGAHCCGGFHHDIRTSYWKALGPNDKVVRVIDLSTSTEPQLFTFLRTNIPLMGHQSDKVAARKMVRSCILELYRRAVGEDNLFYTGEDQQEDEPVLVSA